MIAHTWDYAPALGALCALATGLLLAAAHSHDHRQHPTGDHHVNHHPPDTTRPHD